MCGMDLFYRLVDLFQETAQRLAFYMPQSGDDVIKLFKQLLTVGMNLNIWIMRVIGIDLQSILKTIGKAAVNILGLLFDLVKSIVERL